MDETSEKPDRLIVTNAPGISPAQLLEVTERLERMAKEGKLPTGNHSVFYRHDPACAFGTSGECNCTPEILFGPPNTNVRDEWATGWLLKVRDQ